MYACWYNIQQRSVHTWNTEQANISCRVMWKVLSIIATCVSYRVKGIAVSAMYKVNHGTHDWEVWDVNNA